RMALHVAQQDLLGLAVDVEVEDGRVEPLVLAGEPEMVVLDLDRLRILAGTVDDRRHVTAATQAAARTLAFVRAAGGREVVIGSHVGVAFFSVMRLSALAAGPATRSGVVPGPGNRASARARRCRIPRPPPQST